MNHPDGLRTRLRNSLDRLFGSDNCDSGLAAIEFGMIAPVLALAIIGTVDLGMGIYRKMQVQNAAQAGAEYAVTHGFVASAVTSAITNATALPTIQVSPEPVKFCGCPSAAGVIAAACGSTCPGGAQAGTYITASARTTYVTLLPYPLFPTSFDLAAQSTVRIQ
jgi:Flp pilus assembly protein TadG